MMVVQFIVTVISMGWVVCTKFLNIMSALIVVLSPGLFVVFLVNHMKTITINNSVPILALAQTFLAQPLLLRNLSSRFVRVTVSSIIYRFLLVRSNACFCETSVFLRADL